MSESETFTTWHPAPTQRGTFGILITCLTTLGISLWSALHLNIQFERQSWKMTLARKVFWMLIGLLLPEWLIYITLCQYLSAKEVRNEVNRHRGFPKLVPWYQRLIRSGTAQPEHARQKGTSEEMQNLVMNRKTSSEAQSIGGVDSTNQPAAHLHRWTMTHGYYAVMRGFAGGKQSPTGFGTIEFLLEPRGFLDLLDKRPDLIADISKEAISDKGKSDSLAKALLIVQVGWFCVNCISRLIQQLPLTLLEVSTAAHALCAFVVYLVWWDKPLNVTEPTILPDQEISNSIYDSDRRSKPSYRNYSGVYRLYKQLQHILDTEMDTTPAGDSERIAAVTFIVVGLFYGAPHLLAWNINFPTHVEKVLWRTCTLAVILSPTFLVILLVFLTFISEKTGYTVNENLLWCSVGLNCLIYFPASLYLVVAGVRQLFYLPPDAFEVPVWSNYFPHIS